MIDGAPADVVEAAARLACTEVVIVNLGVDRPTSSTRTGRISTTATSSSRGSARRTCSRRNNVPPGCGSLQAECYYSHKYRPLRLASPRSASSP